MPAEYAVTHSTQLIQISAEMVADFKLLLTLPPSTACRDWAELSFQERACVQMTQGAHVQVPLWCQQGWGSA